MTEPVDIQAARKAAEAAVRYRYGDPMARHVFALADALEQAHAREAARRDEVRRRALSSFYTGTYEGASKWWTCQMCYWGWRDGQPENHNAGCPAAVPTGGTGS